MAVTKRKLCYFVLWTLHGKVIDTISFDDIIWKGAFYKDFYLRNFFRK